MYRDVGEDGLNGGRKDEVFPSGAFIPDVLNDDDDVDVGENERVRIPAGYVREIESFLSEMKIFKKKRERKS